MLLCALAITSCASGDGSSSISKAQLIVRGDKICERADNTEYEESIKYEQSHKGIFAKLSAQKALERLLVVVGLPSILKEGRELEALGMPAGDAKELGRLYSEIKVAVVKARKRLKAIDQPNGPFATPDRLAEGYGFKACSQIA